MADGKCLPRIPFEKWAVDAGIKGGEQDWENWRYIRTWATQLLDNCLSSCDPMAVRCHVINGCGGLEYDLLTASGDYAMGGTSVSFANGLVLPAPGIWHIGLNGHGTLSTGAHMGQGLFTVTHPGPATFDYGVAVGNEDDTVSTHVSMSGAVDHMVPASATVALTPEGSAGVQFPGSFNDTVLYAHRIECTADLVDAYP